MQAARTGPYAIAAANPMILPITEIVSKAGIQFGKLIGTLESLMSFDWSRVVMPKRLPVFIICFLVGTETFGQAASQPLLLGESFTIDSGLLDESRRVLIAVPQSYQRSDERYGVVYVLDAETQFEHIVSSTQFLAGFANQSIPPVIVVGIANTDRMRDLTPASGASESSAFRQGGADQFLRFVVDELFPWVDQNYRTSDFRVLVGHSLGGLFAVHALSSAPDVFDALLVIDPSLNWNAQEPARHATEFLAAGRQLNTALYLALSSPAAPESAGSRRVIDALSSSAADDFRWSVAQFTGESHDSIPLPAAFQGLRWIFADWNVDDLAEGVFSAAPAQDILDEIDQIYMQSGRTFGLERETPYLVFESLLSYLAETDRVDEAASLTLRHTDRYPLPLVPNVIAGIAELLAEGRGQRAAVDYLNAVIEIYPGNETAQDALIELGVDPSGNVISER